MSGKLQSYVTVVFPEDSETIRIKIKTESMEIQNYKFTHGGATGNDWNNHGGISFMVTKKLEKLSVEELKVFDARKEFESIVGA